jgi:hypothetical protein
MFALPPNKSLQPTPDGAGRSVPHCGTGHVTGPEMEQSRTQRDTAQRMLRLSLGC